MSLTIALVHARLDAIVRGAYPSPAVSGRTMTAGTLKSAALHGELDDPEFPGVAFDGGYSLLLTASGQADGEARTNARSGLMRRALSYDLRTGHAFGRLAPLGTGNGTALSAVLVAAHDVHEECSQALRDPLNWSGLASGPSIYAVRRAGSAQDVTSQVIDGLQRVLVTSRYVVEIAYSPSAVA